MWTSGWRDTAWGELDQDWDILVIGGGITGAGILREAVRSGYRALLVDGQDFAAGASSRSSKLVHGGFRYLKNGQVRLTYESVRERERLLQEGRGLVNPIGFLFANFNGDPMPGWVFGAGLVVYDLLALKWGHRHYDAYDIHDLCPYLNTDPLQGGYRYFDAQTDDARLVVRVIQEAVQAGGTAINYARVAGLLQDRSANVQGVILEDREPASNRAPHEVRAGVVINATGAWADTLRSQVGTPPRLRQLRGSHLVMPAQRLPLTRAISYLHPSDGRPVFAIPWEGVVLVGTTDVDHQASLDEEPRISTAEANYLLDAVRLVFPCQELCEADVIATFAGVRPVVNTGKRDPSKESREHVLWTENGLVTVTGGKLTTFHRMAVDALDAANRRLSTHQRRKSQPGQPVLDAVGAAGNQAESSLSKPARLRLVGRYGRQAAALVAGAGPDELVAIPGSHTLRAELKWAAQAEAVVHLEDLLLRRTRLGLQMPDGGIATVEDLRTSLQPVLGWSDQTWQAEIAAYSQLWKACYHLPD